MKNIFYTLAIMLVFVNITSCNNKVKEYQIENHLSFDCPLKIDSAADIFNVIKSINPNTIYFGVCTKDDDRYMISISKYTSDEPMSIDTAFFDYTANEIPDNNMGEYQILDAGKYVKDNYTYYRKISCSNGTIANVMFYMMKENKSNYLYEFKMNGYIGKKEYIIDVLEKTVRSVEFE
jgi:hypothetical protein